MLRPLDILLALKIAVNDRSFTLMDLSEALGVSLSQVHRSIKRCEKSGFIGSRPMVVSRPALREFLKHGIKYAFPAERGPIARGMPTSYSAFPLNEVIIGTGMGLVWPHPKGSVRGESVTPLTKTAPDAAMKDNALYQALALVDALRTGRARERYAARELLDTLLIKTSTARRDENG